MPRISTVAPKSKPVAKVEKGKYLELHQIIMSYMHYRRVKTRLFPFHSHYPSFPEGEEISSTKSISRILQGNVAKHSPLMMLNNLLVSSSSSQNRQSNS